MSCVLVEKMELPEACLLGSTIYKKQFLNAGDLTAGDKRILSQQVEKVIWQASLKPGNINIRPYRDDVREYEEVEIIEARLNEMKKIHRIAEIVMRTIPYPILLQLTYQDQIMLVVGHSRTNLSDSSKNTIEEYLYTDWFKLDNLTEFQVQFFDLIHSSKLSFSNFYRFYDGVLDQVILLNASKWADCYFNDKDAKEVKQVSDSIASLEQKIEELRAALRKETQFNRRVELNVEMSQAKHQKDSLIEKSKREKQMDDR